MNSVSVNDKDCQYILVSACHPDHQLCASAFSVDTLYYCKQPWLKENCREMCKLGCVENHVEEVDVTESNKNERESILLSKLTDS